MCTQFKKMYVVRIKTTFTNSIRWFKMYIMAQVIFGLWIDRLKHTFELKLNFAPSFVFFTILQFYMSDLQCGSPYSLLWRQRAVLS